MNSVCRANRRRIGLLLPSANLVMEADFYRNLPETINLYTTHMCLTETTVAGEEKMLDEYVLPAARNIENVKPDVVVFGCTGAGALRGKQFEAALIKSISEITDAPVVSVMSTVKKEMDRAGVKCLIVVTPYVPFVDARLVGSLEEDGFEVLNISGLGISQSIQLGEVPGERIIEFTHQTSRGFHPDGIFIVCTNFPAMSVLPILPRQLPVPVFFSNQSTYNVVLETLENLAHLAAHWVGR
ncbi:MAG: aspartate/glutamate racemase family protein [Anaerolineaceae bacterium]|nr:aspartate/glutamate racemase family protein [Anaerolineaceae bacterium]